MRFSTCAGTSACFGVTETRSAPEYCTSYIDGTYTPGMRASARSTSVARPVAGATTGLPGRHDLGDLGHDLLAVAQHHEIQEVGDRLGVVGAVPAGRHERVLGTPVGRPHRHTGEVDAVQHVRVDELGRQVESDQVEVGRRPVRVDREERQIAGAQLRLEVDPWGVGPFRHRIGALVQDLVQDLQALVGQADLVGVGVNEQPGDLAGAVLGTDRTVLEPDVASGFLDLGQQGFELGPKIGHFARSLPAPRTGR